ncbi:MAG: DUF1045 domain-containing protein [Devosia sp.]
MPQRFAIYYAPPRGSALDVRSANWLKRPELREATIAARRYGFHATIKAPMALKTGTDQAGLAAALATFGRENGPVMVGRIEPRIIDGFLALVPVIQPRELTDFAELVVEAFDRFRAPLDARERQRRLSAPLSDRQIKLLDTYGYPYVLEQFQFHMTLTDRLPLDRQAALLADAKVWFAPALATQLVVDRLVLFHEAEPGTVFFRGEDFVLKGPQ